MEGENKTNEKNPACANPNCTKEAKLRCPNCKKYGIKDGSFFCGKECFTSTWAEHKKVHKDCKQT